MDPPYRLDAAIVVGDMPRMTRFYSDGIGCAHIADIDSAAGRIRRLDCGASELKLFAPTRTPRSDGESRGLLECGGVRYVSLYVDDVGCRLALACEHGGRMVRAPEEGEYPRWAMLQDPEQNFVELVEAS